MCFVQNFGFIKNEHRAIGVIKDCRVQRKRKGQQESRAGEEFSSLGEGEFFVKVLLKDIRIPVLPSRFSPLLHHLFGNKDVLHGKDVDMLNGAARTLIIKIELPNRVHAVAEEFHSDRCAHQRREHVHDSAADGKLPGSRHGLLAQIPRNRKMLNEELLRNIVALRHVQAIAVEVEGATSRVEAARIDVTTMSARFCRRHQSVVALVCRMPA